MYYNYNGTIQKENKRKGKLFKVSSYNNLNNNILPNINSTLNQTSLNLFNSKDFTIKYEDNFPKIIVKQDQSDLPKTIVIKDFSTLRNKVFKVPQSIRNYNKLTFKNIKNKQLISSGHSRSNSILFELKDFDKEKILNKSKKYREIQKSKKQSIINVGDYIKTNIIKLSNVDKRKDNFNILFKRLENSFIVSYRNFGKMMNKQLKFLKENY